MSLSHDNQWLLIKYITSNLANNQEVIAMLTPLLLHWASLTTGDVLTAIYLVLLVVFVVACNYLFESFVESKPEGRKTVLGQLSWTWRHRKILLAITDTLSDSIQCLNFAKNWFNSMFDSLLFTQNSIQSIVQIKFFQANLWIGRKKWVNAISDILTWTKKG